MGRITARGEYQRFSNTYPITVPKSINKRKKKEKKRKKKKTKRKRKKKEIG